MLSRAPGVAGWIETTGKAFSPRIGNHFLGVLATTLLLSITASWPRSTWTVNLGFAELENERS